MAMNKYGGVNDMSGGWSAESPLNKRIYTLWFGMLRRCYDAKQLGRKRGKTYANVVVCDRWFYLRNFVEDIQKLDGYKDWVENRESMALDKDLVAQEVTKIYSPSTCTFLTNADNCREMNERCKDSHRKTVYVLYKGNEHHVFYSEAEACEFLGQHKSAVASAWIHKGTCGGYNVIRIGNKTDYE